MKPLELHPTEDTTPQSAGYTIVLSGGAGSGVGFGSGWLSCSGSGAGWASEDDECVGFGAGWGSEVRSGAGFGSGGFQGRGAGTGAGHCAHEWRERC